MSAPAQKLSPSPVRTTARASPTSENASVSSRISSASKAFRRSGFAIVTLRTYPSRSMRSAPMRVSLESEHAERSARRCAHAASGRGRGAGRGRVRAVRRVSGRRRPRRDPRAGDDRRGNPAAGGRAQAGGRALRRGRAGRIRRCRALRRADHVRDGCALGTCGRDRRGRRRGHRAAVLRARRTRADAALRGGRRGLCAAPVLPLRVSGSGRVLDPARGDPAGPRAVPEPRRPQGLEPAVRGCGAVHRRRARRLRRRGVAGRARPGAWGGRSRVRARFGVPAKPWRSSSASVRATSASCARRSSGSRSRRRRSSASAGSASRFARTFGDRFARSCPTSRKHSAHGSNRHSRRRGDRRQHRVPARAAGSGRRRSRRPRPGRFGRHGQGDGRRSPAVLDRGGGPARPRVDRLLP